MVCLDEISKQLIGEVRLPVPATPGAPERYDSEYVRNGVANVFAVCEPLRGQREFTVTDRRTKVDWAHLIKDLVDVRHPHSERIILVMDQLNIHHPASLSLDP